MHYIGNDMIILCPGSTGDGGCKGRYSDVLTSPVKLEAPAFPNLGHFYRCFIHNYRAFVPLTALTSFKTPCSVCYNVNCL